MGRSGNNMQRVDVFLKKVEEKAWSTGMPIIGSKKGTVLVNTIKKHKPRAVLEIGTLVGYSSILMARHLPLEGKIITIEVDEHAAMIAERNIASVGFSDRIRVIVGNARKVIPELNDKFDFVFIDAVKEDYLDFLKLAENKLRRGGVVVADNAGIFADRMKDYLDYVRGSGKYQSKYYDFPEVNDGVEVSVRK